LKESFGFIHCADRPEEIFFHYSELVSSSSSNTSNNNSKNPNTRMMRAADDLEIDTEVEFKVGPSDKDPSKKAAYDIVPLETGTVVWETEEDPDTFFQGLVERNIRTDSRGSSNSSNNNSAGGEGSIQVVAEKVEEEKEDSATTASTTKTNEPQKKGPLVRFRADDYQPTTTNNTNSNNPRMMNQHRLFRGDLVQFRILTDRRTKQRYARYITLLQTEKERTRIEKEKELLANATEEEGVVISLNKGFGFIKSNKRRDHVYFHYSNLSIPTGGGQEEDGTPDFELKKGQELKFVVVSETVDGQTQPKCSARKLECLPKGSVMFHTVVAKGVKGVVTLVPQPPSGRTPGYADDRDGTIRLVEPILMEQPPQKDGGEPPQQVVISDVSLLFSDAPGGMFTFQQRGAKMNGLWILEGDVLLMDVVQDLADGSYQAAPTRHTLGFGGTVEEPTTTSVVDTDAETDTTANEEEDASQAVIRLVACSLVSRAEGTLHTLKVSGGYGFIHFAERPIDVHFNTYNLMPDELQIDLRKQLGVDETQVKLDVNAGVQFDICAHGTVAGGGHHNHRGGGGGGRQNTTNNRRGSPHERENVKAHRVLLLPTSAVRMEQAIATGVKGVIKSADTKQLYAGFVDLEEALETMSLEERHPLVAQMIDSFLEESGKPTGRKSLVFRDVLSVKDDEIVVEMVKSKSNGFLSVKHIPVAGMSQNLGRLCIRRIEEAAEEEEEATEEVEATPSKQKQQVKANTQIRFDKSSLSEELLEELPPGAGDIVTCDIAQSRRTGKFIVHNLKIVERGEPTPGASTESSGLGIIQNVVPKSNFGFISVLDENATRRELIYFSLSADKQSRRVAFRKGDEVKFDIGVDTKTGKRMASNVQIVPKGTIPSTSTPSKNACQGILLMEPTHTSLGDTPLRRKQSGDSFGSSKSGGGRWGNVKEDSNKAQHLDVHEEGRVLLLEDQTGMFSKKSRSTNRRKRSGSVDGSDDGDAKSVDDDASVSSVDTTSSDDARSMGTSGTDGDEDFEGEDAGTVLSHLSYKNGAIAIHGAGSAGSMASSNPRRGDIVSFVKAKNGRTSVRDLRVVTRQGATMLRGRLENIEFGTGESKKNTGKAKFIAATEEQETYEIDLAEVVGCSAAVLKDKQTVEGILHDGKIYGVCRSSDLYLESKLGTSHKERPKLNISVRKNRAGNIVAQSMMGKGPDGTIGFAAGWTTRKSQYTNLQNAPAS
jgi:cold shock CspA family protein